MMGLVMQDRKGLIIDEKQFFGPLYDLINDIDITDIDISGPIVWITLKTNERIKTDIEITQEFSDQFAKRVSDMESMPFHRMSPVLEAETDTLRITIVHEDVCQGRRSICIRKSLRNVRLTEESVIRDKYMSEETLSFLKSCVFSGMNIVIAGNPGAGKTECARFLSKYIPDDQRVITIEDTPEWHYRMMKRNSDCVEIKVGKNMDYTKAIKTCMRLNPKWMMLSEARSIEVLSLMECFSTGVKGMTTIHTDDVRTIPDRILNMAAQKRDESRLLNDIYTFIDIGVLIRRKEFHTEDGNREIRRFVDQMAVFTREDGINRTTLILDDGEATGAKLPESILKRFKRSGQEYRLDRVKDLIERNMELIKHEAEAQRMAEEKRRAGEEIMIAEEERRAEEVRRISEIADELEILKANGGTYRGERQESG